VINLLLKGDDSQWVIESALCDEKYKGMAYEEVYKKLLEEQKKNKGKGNKSGGKGSPGQGGGGQGQPGQNQPGEGGGNGAPKPGEKNVSQDGMKLPMADVIPGDKGNGDGTDAAEAERAAQGWVTRIIEAQLYAKSIGKGSSAAERVLDLAQGGTVPWQELMRQAITEAIVHDRQNWSYPHRRAEAFGFYMPREEFNGCDATVVVDTSGSISKKNVESALREINDIIIAAGGQVRWLVGDTTVLQDEWIRTAPDKITGCGGTDFRPFFDHLTNGEGKPTKMLIYFTDTYGVFPEEEPPFPVIWAVYDDNKETPVPFGEVIQIPSEAA
jgi:predicted metal-dependent peptidase